MSEAGRGLGPEDFAMLWEALRSWEQRRPKVLDLPGCRAQLYMGAMEIPMLALRPSRPVSPVAAQLESWQPTLGRLGLELDCVTPDANYKLNRHDSGEYVGRILPDALKFHAERVTGLDRGALEALCLAYLALPGAEGALP